MQEYATAGYDPASYWSLTPRVLNVLLKAASDRMMNQHNMQVWHTYHIAALTRAKKMPSLDKLRPRQRPKPMTVDQMKSAARRWHVAINAKNRGGK